MKGTLTVLGCGNSTGVPAVCNYWGKCDPNEPKNRRTRSSVLVQTDSTSIVVDSGADFREQMNRADVKTLDAVLYTHAHSDHVGGIDDIRMISYQRSDLVPLYGNKETMEELEERFHYLFKERYDIYPEIVKSNIVEYGETYKVGDIEFLTFEQDHGTCKSVGYRFGDTAYCVDVWDLDAVAIETLKGVKTLIIDAAAYNIKANPVHASLEKIYAWNEEIGAKKVYLTSLTLAMDYQTLLKELPEGFEPAYDGLEIAVSGED